MSKLEWKLLTKKRASATQGVPPGKEHLAWVTNTVTLTLGRFLPGRRLKLSITGLGGAGVSAAPIVTRL